MCPWDNTRPHSALCASSTRDLGGEGKGGESTTHKHELRTSRRTGYRGIFAVRSSPFRNAKPPPHGFSALVRGWLASLFTRGWRRAERSLRLCDSCVRLHSSVQNLGYRFTHRFRSGDFAKNSSLGLAVFKDHPKC